MEETFSTSISKKALSGLKNDILKQFSLLQLVSFIKFLGISCFLSLFLKIIIIIYFSFLLASDIFSTALG